MNESVEIVRRWVEAANGMDGEALAALADPAIEVTYPERFPGAGTHRGLEEAGAAFAAELEAWEDFRMEVDELTATGAGQVFAAVTERGRGRGSGIEVEQPVFSAWTVRDGRVARIRFFLDRGEALRAAGFDPVARLRRGYEAFNRRDYDAIMRDLAPDIEARDRAEMPDPESYEGRDAVEGAFRAVHEEFEDYRMEPREFVDLGDRIVVVLRQSGRGRLSGLPVAGEVVHLWDVQGDRVSGLRAFSTREEAMEAAGASG